MEMGHKYVTTTQEYLKFQLDEIKDHFPSLTPYIEEMENIQKKSIRATKMRARYNSNNVNLHSSTGR